MTESIVAKTFDQQIREQLLTKAANVDSADPKSVRAHAELLVAYARIQDVQLKNQFKAEELALEREKFEHKKLMDQRKVSVYESRFSKKGEETNGQVPPSMVSTGEGSKA